MHKRLQFAFGVRRSMQGNRGVETRLELSLRKALWAARIRGYRKNVRKLPGKPDLVFGRAKLAVFVHGCYWHQCPRCTRNRTPKTNALYWEAKFAANRERDERSVASLEAMGHRVLVLWECEIKGDLAGCVEKVCSELSRGSDLG